MREIVIGCTGFIGQAVHARIPDAVGTTRADLNLLGFDAQDVPKCDVAYLCAGANGAWRCEGKPDGFRVNTDAPYELAHVLRERGAFMVHLSSMSVEWLDGAYQRSKLAAEGLLRPMPNVGIVRAGRVTKDNLQDLVDTLLAVGRNRTAGLTRWGTDEIAYQK